MTDEEVDVAIGGRVREVRSRLGLSQGELADLLRRNGVPWSQGTLSKVENGERPIRLGEAPMVALALDMQLEELASGRSRLPAAIKRTIVDIREAEDRVFDSKTQLELVRSYGSALELVREMSLGLEGPFEVIGGNVYDLLYLVTNDPTWSAWSLNDDDIIESLRFVPEDFSMISSDLATWAADKTKVPDYFPITERDSFKPRFGHLENDQQHRDRLYETASTFLGSAPGVETLERELRTGRLGQLISERYPFVKFRSGRTDTLQITGVQEIAPNPPGIEIV